ncbi:hydroxyisourate hydrolase [Paenibacillus kandeliae]|uniref:hydroxyisourate hydrolase n=1 Tax=Paenibacillus kandeliae TaxID=3231269 RepID=UPI00345A2495
MSGKLTTHVLDLGQGCPAVGVRIELYRDGETQPLRTAVTNSDGRVDQPLLSGDELVSGTYELHFYAGDYHRQLGIPAADSSIWDVIPLRFVIQDIDSNYHIPLLVSPGGYSTYRGS